MLQRGTRGGTQFGPPLYRETLTSRTSVEKLSVAHIMAWQFKSVNKKNIKSWKYWLTFSIVRSDLLLGSRAALEDCCFLLSDSYSDCKKENSCIMTARKGKQLYNDCNERKTWRENSCIIGCITNAKDCEGTWNCRIFETNVATKLVWSLYREEKDGMERRNVTIQPFDPDKVYGSASQHQCTAKDEKNTWLTH